MSAESLMTQYGRDVSYAEYSQKFTSQGKRPPLTMDEYYRIMRHGGFIKTLPLLEPLSEDKFPVRCASLINYVKPQRVI